MAACFVYQAVDKLTATLKEDLVIDKHKLAKSGETISPKVFFMWFLARSRHISIPLSFPFKSSLPTKLSYSFCVMCTAWRKQDPTLPPTI